MITHQRSSSGETGTWKPSEESRGEQRRAEESRGEQRRAEESRGEQRRAEEERGQSLNIDIITGGTEEAGMPRQVRIEGKGSARAYVQKSVDSRGVGRWGGGVSFRIKNLPGNWVRSSRAVCEL
jgi:hypothetical protein